MAFLTSCLRWLWARTYDYTLPWTIGGAASVDQLRGRSFEAAQLRPGERVLDVGCGTGDWAIHARDYVGDGGSVVGIDPLPEMVNLARGKLTGFPSNLSFHVAGADVIPFPVESFDVVMTSLVLHHISPPVEPAIKEMCRVLRKGGRLIIVDFAGRGTHNHGHGTHHSFDAFKLEALLAEAGLVDMEHGWVVESSKIGFIKGFKKSVQ